MNWGNRVDWSSFIKCPHHFSSCSVLLFLYQIQRPKLFFFNKRKGGHIIILRHMILPFCTPPPRKSISSLVSVDFNHVFSNMSLNRRWLVSCTGVHLFSLLKEDSTSQIEEIPEAFKKKNQKHPEKMEIWMWQGGKVVYEAKAKGTQ